MLTFSMAISALRLPRQGAATVSVKALPYSMSLRDMLVTVMVKPFWLLALLEWKPNDNLPSGEVDVYVSPVLAAVNFFTQPAGRYFDWSVPSEVP